MSRQISALQKFKNFRPGTTLVMLLVVCIWLLPTVGLVVTAFRPQMDSVTTGWWTAIIDPFHQNWTTDALKGVFSKTWNIGNSFMATVAVCSPRNYPAYYLCRIRRIRVYLSGVPR